MTRVTLKAAPNQRSLADTFSTPLTKLLPLADDHGREKGELIVVLMTLSTLPGSWAHGSVCSTV